MVGERGEEAVDEGLEQGKGRIENLREFLVGDLEIARLELGLWLAS